MSEIEQVTLTINEQELTAPKGTLLIDVATRHGIEIPVFCSHPKLDPVACCRQCLVEMDGPRGTMLNTACNTPVMEGMVVRTDTPAAREAQEANLAFILLHHPLDCPICDKGGECPLQDMTLRFGPGVSQLVEPKRHARKNYAISDTIVLDQERCVVCWRCVRYLEEWEEKPQLGLFERGGDTVIDVQPGQCVDAKTSGNIIDICPVGALTNHSARFQYRPWQIERTGTISLHDPMGNNISVDTRNGTEVRRIQGRENMAVNDQFITDKDRFCHHWANHPDRLTRPLLRRNGVLQEASWEDTLAFVGDRLAAIRDTAGSQALGVIGGSKLSNESNYLLQRLARQALGTNNIDHRQGGDVKAGTSGVPALAHLMQIQYGPKPQADVVWLLGVDPSEEIPMLDVHLKRAASRGGTRLFVAHPRRTESAARAEVHLQYAPGLETALVQALIRRVLAQPDAGPEQSAWQTWADTPEIDAGVAVQDLDRLATALLESQNAVLICGPDSSHQQEGQALHTALEALATLTGHRERLAFIGLDANSQGCRDMGLVPHQLPGGYAVDGAAARHRLEELWGSALPAQPGLTYTEMLDRAGDAIQGLYLMGADPAAENPRWAANLANAQLVVVQELFRTATAELADVVLPAVSWLETDGTFTNMECRVQRSPQAITNPDSDAAPDWLILDHVAARLGHDWSYKSAREITTELGQAIPAYAGLDWDSLGDQGRQRLPDAVDVTTLAGPVATPVPAPPAPDALRLFRGRLFYDAGRLTSLTPEIVPSIPAPFLAVHPADVQSRGLQAGSEVTVTSAYGTLSTTLRADARVAPGSAWMPDSLGDKPVGTLLNGNYWEWATLHKTAAGA